MTNIREPSSKQIAQWEVQSAKAAGHLKHHACPDDPVKVGFAFDDAFVKVLITKAEIAESTEPGLRSESFE